MPEETYGKDRAQRLAELLRALAERILSYRRDPDLLADGPQLLKMMGDARSELFHYEVRATYDTPEVAESRRIVDEAKKQRPVWELDADQPWEGER